MKSKSIFSRSSGAGVFWGTVVVGAICCCGTYNLAAQDAHSPSVDQIVKLTKAQMSDDVILNYIKGSGTQYNLTADDLVYLKTQGVSQPVISALLQTHSAAAPAAPAPPPPPSYSSQEPASPAPAPQPPSDYQPPPPPPQPDTAPPPPPPATTVTETHGFLGLRLPGLSIGVPTTTVVTETAPPPPDAPAPEPPPVNFDYFHDQLQPYGVWESDPNNGWLWFPSEQSVNPAWRPYADGGHWEYSDQGMLWQSDYPWGDVVFHYGRWMRMGDGRWAWAPGYDWAPAWVMWRHDEAEGSIGWAPLPPAAEFRVGYGLWWHGGPAVDVDFGLGPDYFTFVGFDHFWDHDFHRYFYDRDRVRFFYGHSFIRNGYRYDHGRFFVDGVGRDRLREWTHHDVRVIRADEFRRDEFHRDVLRREGEHPEIRRANLDRERREGYARPAERGGERPGERPGEGRPGERPGERAESRPGENGGRPGYGTQGKPAASQGKSNGSNNSKDKEPK